MVSNYTRLMAAVLMAVCAVLFVWHPGHAALPVLTFLAGIAVCAIVGRIAPGDAPQLEVLRVPPEEEDFERAIMGMVGTEEIFLRTMSGLNHGLFPGGPEVILYAAIRHPDGRIFAVSRPGRHGHVQQLMEMLNSNSPEAMELDRQGFITSLGAWLSREDALVVATRNNQIIRKHPQNYELYSEDMWEAV